ncbi:MAG: hypothetical protein NVV62_14445 [Terricaulis sp.]|nr:hypothetical protein [Terricaulis sp.]
MARRLLVDAAALVVEGPGLFLTKSGNGALKLDARRGGAGLGIFT